MGTAAASLPRGEMMAETQVYSNYRIAPWTAEFVHPGVEADYRRRAARVTSRQGIVALALSSLAFLVFIVSDFLDVGRSDSMEILAAVRGGTALAGLLALAWLSHRPMAATTGVAVSLFEIVAFAAFGIVIEIRQISLELGAVNALAMLAAVYFFLPNRAIQTMAIGLTATVAYLASVWLLGGGAERPSVFIDVALLMAFLNGFGAIGAWRLSRLPREEYRLIARAAQANTQLAEEIAKRGRLERKLTRQASTDALTGLTNRRRYVERTLEELQQARRTRRPVSVLVLDIDFFKRINDRHGHAAGDRALRGVSAVLRRELRNTDLLARYGGEEFAVTLPDTDADGALAIAERLRTAIETGSQLSPVAVTVTIGVAAAAPDESLDSVLSRADQALYSGKEAGRNRVKVIAGGVRR